MSCFCPQIRKCRLHLLSSCPKTQKVTDYPVRGPRQHCLRKYSLGSPMRTATPPHEVSTDRGSREETQLFSTETNLYGSPGVAFTVKKTGATYGTPSPPRKPGDVLGRRSSVRSATSMSEVSDNEVNL